MKFKCVSVQEWGEDGLQVGFRLVKEAGDEGEETADFSHRARGTRKDAVSKYEVGQVYDLSVKAASK